MGLPWWLGLPFWALAVLFSAFYGWKARDIFQVKRPEESWAYLAHQAWFNFVALRGIEWVRNEKKSFGGREREEPPFPRMCWRLPKDVR